jgi:nucleotidyltransferase substrate binding protein (TIGR01987 family)
MSAELGYAIERFERAVERLREGVDRAREQLERDGTIQRFEFSVELLWKTLRRFLLARGINVSTPRESLEEAFRVGWLDEETVFLDMLTDRNRTSHLYSDKVADEIFSRIRSDYVGALEKILERLRSVAGGA